MENDKLDKSMFRDDFKDFADFDEEEVISPEVEMEEAQEAVEDAIQEEVSQVEAVEEVAVEVQEVVEEQAQEETEEIEEAKEENLATYKKLETVAEPRTDISQWEEVASDNSVVKKYIIYVGREYTKYLDNLTLEKRSEFIQDAIQKKLDVEEKDRIKETKKRLTTHFVLMILTFIIATPIMIWFAHIALMATFDNYKYSQENFEKLYKQRFEKDRAYMRSIQYNKEQRAKLKNKNK